MLGVIYGTQVSGDREEVGKDVIKPVNVVSPSEAG